MPLVNDIPEIEPAKEILPGINPVVYDPKLVIPLPIVNAAVAPEPEVFVIKTQPPIELPMYAEGIFAPPLV